MRRTGASGRVAWTAPPGRRHCSHSDRCGPEGWDTGLIEDVVLVASEPVANVIAHGSAPVTFTVTVRTAPEPAVVIGVADTSPALPIPDRKPDFGTYPERELDVLSDLPRAITEWRATARIWRARSWRPRRPPPSPARITVRCLLREPQAWRRRPLRPPVGYEWRLRFATKEAAKGWSDLCTEAPVNTRHCYEALRATRSPRATLIADIGRVATRQT